jgi:hypothetical protein
MREIDRFDLDNLPLPEDAANIWRRWTQASIPQDSLARCLVVQKILHLFALFLSIVGIIAVYDKDNE